MARQPPEGFISALVLPIAEGIAEHHALPPDKKALARVELGTGLLGLCGYAAVTVGPYLPRSWLLGLLAVAGFGLMLLAAGLRVAQRPRDMMTAFWCLAFLGGLWWVLAHWLPELWANFFGRGLCVGMICAACARLFVALRIGGDAERAVRRNMAAKNPPIIPVRRPR